MNDDVKSDWDSCRGNFTLMLAAATTIPQPMR